MRVRGASRPGRPRGPPPDGGTPSACGTGGRRPATGGPDRQEARMSEKRRLSDHERWHRRAEDRERLKAAAEQLLTSKGWQRWVGVRAQGGLARLSLNNQLLVALAR